MSNGDYTEPAACGSPVRLSQKVLVLLFHAAAPMSAEEIAQALGASAEEVRPRLSGQMRRRLVTQSKRDGLNVYTIRESQRTFMKQLLGMNVARTTPVQKASS